MDQLAGQPILSKKKYQSMAKDGSFGGAMSSDAKPEDIVGSGPFMFGNYVRGDSVTLKRNPNYWKKGVQGKKLPYLDSLYFHIVKEQKLIMLDFERGISDAYNVRQGADVARLKPVMKEQNFSLYQ